MNSKERSTLVVNPHSWHCRIYNFWRTVDFRISNKPIPGKPLNYKENLCHYWRVVTLWGPLCWFLFAHPKGKKWLTPATSILMAGAIGFIVTMFIIQPIGSLWFAVQMLIAALGFALIIGLLEYASHHKDAIIDFCERIADATETPRRHIGNFFHASFATRSAAVFWLLVAAVGFAVLMALVPIIAVFVMLAAVLCGSFAYFCVIMGEDVMNTIDEHMDKKRSDKGDSFARLTGHYIVSKKHRICPFIEVSDR